MIHTLHKDDIDRFNAVRHIIETDFKSHFTIEELAQKAGVSGSKLKAGFRQLFQTSPYQLLTNVRIEKAKDILENKEYPVKCVAGILGFSDVSTFIKCFKRSTGLSPKEWRNLSKNNVAV
jgi:AraC-like DNA-binding protein